MSSNEKTKNKLMETMRMTKADPGKKVAVAAADTKKTKTPQNDKPKTDKNTAPKKVVKDKQKLSVDPYQTARRVWPD